MRNRNGQVGGRRASNPMGGSGLVFRQSRGSSGGMSCFAKGAVGGGGSSGRTMMSEGGGGHIGGGIPGQTSGGGPSLGGTVGGWDVSPRRGACGGGVGIRCGKSGGTMVARGGSGGGWG